MRPGPEDNPKDIEYIVSINARYSITVDAALDADAAYDIARDTAKSHIESGQFHDFYDFELEVIERKEGNE